MKINDLEFHLVEIGCTGMAEPVRSLLVRLTTDSGLKGWGESGLAWRPGELAARRDALLPVLAGRSVFDIEELHTLEALASAPLRTAVEMACLDLAGKAVGQPLCRLLGGEYRQRIPLAVRLTGRRPERLAQLARELAVQGFYCQVLAASGEAELDRKMLAAVRQCVGDRMELRLDGMAEYDMETARDLCAEIESDELQCLIDPLRTRDLGSLASLGRQTAAPLAVRRAIRSPADVLAAVRLRRGDAGGDRPRSGGRDFSRSRLCGRRRGGRRFGDPRPAADPRRGRCRAVAPRRRDADPFRLQRIGLSSVAGRHVGRATADRKRHDGRAPGPRIGRRGGPGEDRAVWGGVVIARRRFGDLSGGIGMRAIVAYNDGRAAIALLCARRS